MRRACVLLLLAVVAGLAVTGTVAAAPAPDLSDTLCYVVLPAHAPAAVSANHCCMRVGGRWVWGDRSTMTIRADTQFGWRGVPAGHTYYQVLYVWTGREYTIYKRWVYVGRGSNSRWFPGWWVQPDWCI